MGRRMSKLGTNRERKRCFQIAVETDKIEEKKDTYK